MGKMKLGFTLVEVLAVAGIMALFGLTLIGVFLATFRGGIKARLMQQLHQDGNWALLTMSRAIREAETVSCLDGLTLTKADSSLISYRPALDNDVTRIASNSGVFLTGTRANVNNLSFSCYQGETGNNIVTMSFELKAVETAGSQAHEKLTQSFATSVSTRQK